VAAHMLGRFVGRKCVHIANLVGYYANPSAVTSGKRTLLRANAC